MSDYKTELKYCKEHWSEMDPDQVAEFKKCGRRYLVNVTLGLIAGVYGPKLMMYNPAYKSAEMPVKKALNLFFLMGTVGFAHFYSMSNIVKP
jgi:hypothetical protein